VTGGNGTDPTQDMGNEPPGTLAELVEDVVAGLGSVSRTEASGVVTYGRDRSPFAGLDRGALEVRLPPVISRAALRTSHTGQSVRGVDWVRFDPPLLERFDVDRAVAWLEAAWRHAAD
jgi:hypothetical protein